MAIQVSEKVDLSIPEKLKGFFSTPSLILNTSEVRRQYYRLCEALPNVEMYYAVKSFSHPGIIDTLADEGCKFDLASNGEIDTIKCLNVLGEDCIHTHPIKTESEIRYGIDNHVTTFVVDNIYELEKFYLCRDKVKLLVRLGFQNKDVVVDLSKKFGCSAEDACMLIEKARELDINVVGLSFHVGSQCSNSEQHTNAIRVCRAIVEKYSLSILDIGGGFPVNYDTKGADYDIVSFCKPINEELAKLPYSVKVIAEPGRFISAPCMTSYSTIVGKAKRGGSFWYYMNDGVYGSYSGQLFDHMKYPLEVFTDNKHGTKYPSVFAGPTCDSIDVISEGELLPELNIGDVLVGYNMGAYTSASATDFNSIRKAKIIVI